MVNRAWPVLQSSEANDKMDSLSQKLRMLRSEVKSWTKSKSSVMEKDSLRLDVEIMSLLTSSSSGILSQDDQMNLNDLILKKKNLMAHELLTWQLKSRTSWAV